MAVDYVVNKQPCKLLETMMILVVFLTRNEQARGSNPRVGFKNINHINHLYLVISSKICYHL